MVTLQILVHLRLWSYPEHQRIDVNKTSEELQVFLVTQVLDWAPRDHVGDDYIGTVELLRKMKARLLEIRRWEDAAGEQPYNL